MGTKKAVFFDIDGTLWDDSMRILPGTKEAIKSLRKNGHYAFICSGRSRANITARELLDTGFDGILAGCGTYLEFEGKTVLEKKLEQDMLNETLAVLKEANMPAVLEGNTYVYANEEEFGDDFFIRYLKRTLGDRFVPITGNEGRYEVNKISADYSRGDLKLAVSKLEQQYDALVHESVVVELVPKGYSKASGMKKMCEYLGIPMKDTFAFGDSVNDLEMLRAAACGIAMGNASKEAKDIADYVTTEVTKDGIKNGLAHFSLIG